MLHLFQHTSPGNLKGKYDIAFVVKGRYIVGSTQGYNTKRSSYRAMLSLMKNLPTVGGLGSCYFQDDTLQKPTVVILNSNGTTFHTSDKPSKKYIPNKK